MLFVLFFFKQKTAYEMRISDWSSDVCSSDLRSGDTEPRRGDERHRGDPAGQPRARGLPGREHLQPPLEVVDRVQMARRRYRAAMRGLEIGSASCRERVCPYV